MERWEAFRIAELQAVRLRQLLEATEAAFDVTDLSQLPRIIVTRDPNLPSSGMALWSNGAWRIMINSSESQTRQRFSTVHEFKHVLDHSSKHELYGPAHSFDAELAERVADHFAGCVLMPKVLLKRHFGEGPRDVRSLARTFGVSPAAMRVRLRQLGLVEELPRCRRRGSLERTTDHPRATYHRALPIGVMS
jgi:Zn-dependent peptidase ImmA (M78 family)